MRKVIVLFFIGLAIAVHGQNRYPDFTVADIEINIPTTLPGVKPENVSNGNVTYKIRGQVFGEGQNNVIQETTAGFNGKSDRATPYQTLTELVAVVRQSDWKGLKKLYVKESANELDDLVPADKRDDYFKALNENKEIKLIASFEYRNGIMVFIENPDKSVNTAFFVKEKKNYLLKRIIDSSSMLWNLGVYFRFRPEPVKAASLTSKLDSVSINEEQKLVFNLSKNGNWILLFKDLGGSPVIVRVQDGSENDYNAQPGVVEVRLDKSNLSGAKIYHISATESNYPVYMVNEQLQRNATAVSFKVY